MHISRLLIAIYVLFSLSTASAAQYVVGEGYFYAHKEDKMSLIKPQLIYSAFRDIIGKTLKEMGYDPEQFWEAYESKFEERFAPVRKRLEKAYHEGEEGQTYKQQQAFNKALRKSQLLRKKKFLNLSKAMQKWFISRGIKRSSNNSQFRSIVIKAQVDKQYINQLYQRLLGNKRVVDSKQLYLSVNFNFQGEVWSKNLSLVDDIRNAVINKWQTQLQNSTSKYLTTIKLIKDSRVLTELNYHIGKTPEEIKGNGKEEFKNSLWLKIIFDIRETGRNPLLDQLKLNVAGDLSLLNLQNNNVLYGNSWKQQQVSYPMENPSGLASSLGNYLYNLPGKDFSKFPRILKNQNDDFNMATLEMRGYTNIGEIFEIIEFLKTDGIRHDLDINLDVFATDHAKLKMYYSSSNVNLQKWWGTLPAKSVGGQSLSFQFQDNIFLVKLSNDNK